MKYSRNGNTSTKEIDTEVFIFHRTTGKMYSFSEVGKCIWNILACRVTLEQIASTITEGYEVDKIEATKDVKVFLDRLSSRGLLEINEK